MATTENKGLVRYGDLRVDPNGDWVRYEAAAARIRELEAEVERLAFGGGLEAALHAVQTSYPRYADWTPAEDPAEIVLDLAADLDAAEARCRKLEEALQDLIGHARLVASEFDIHYAHLSDSCALLDQADGEEQ